MKATSKRKTATKPKRTRPLRSAGKAAASPKPNTDTRKRAAWLYRELSKLYPDAHCALDHRNAYQLLIATILSAQCTDVRVNMVTPGLFKKYPTPAKMAQAPRDKIETEIYSTGFYRNKAKSIQGASTRIVQQHKGKVPHTMQELLELPGVARKTANVVLGNAFGKNEGVVVDTHIGRLSQRLGLTEHTDPKKIERDLMTLFPKRNWTLLAHLLIHHGRAVCGARRPRCEDCTLTKRCSKIGVTD